MAEDDAAVRGAHDAGGLHEHPLSNLQHLGAGGAQVDRDAGDRENQDDVADRWRQHVEHDHRQQQRREGHDDVGQTRDDLADRARANSRRSGPSADPMVTETSTAPAAIIIVFCAATMIRASKRAAERVGAEDHTASPVERSNGGALRPRRFCLVATAVQQRRAQDRAEQDHSSRKIAATKARLVAQSIARTCAADAGPLVDRSGGICGMVSAMVSSVPDAGIEHRIGDVDQEVHHEDRERGDHDRGEDHGEIALQDASRSSACRRRESRRSSRPPPRRSAAGRLIADHGDDRQHGVAQRMDEDDRARSLTPLARAVLT